MTLSAVTKFTAIALSYNNRFCNENNSTVNIKHDVTSLFCIFCLVFLRSYVGLTTLDVKTHPKSLFSILFKSKIRPTNCKNYVTFVTLFFCCIYLDSIMLIIFTKRWLPTLRCYLLYWVLQPCPLLYSVNSSSPTCMP